MCYHPIEKRREINFTPLSQINFKREKGFFLCSPLFFLLLPFFRKKKTKEKKEKRKQSFFHLLLSPVQEY